MADGGEMKPQTTAEFEKQALEEFNKKIKATIDRERRMIQHFEWRGNKLPPFNIEHMPYERNRLAGVGMTDQDRMLRKQWVMDQQLSPNEPRHIPELNPKNPIRRFFGKPWDIAEGFVRPIVGKSGAAFFRWYVPKFAIATIIIWGTLYNMKYHPSPWECETGFHIYGTRGRILPGDSGYLDPPKKHSDEFNDKGFSERKVMLD